MSAEAKALLDELMGRTRNLDPTQSHDDISFDSSEVCKHFLCGFCPHELFTNTRADLGTCNKIHDDALRKQYKESPRFERNGYEEDFVRFLQTMITDVEKRIKRGHDRLALNNQSGPMNGNPSNQNEEKIILLTEKIHALVEQAEALGCDGKVEEAQGVMKLADQLRDERVQLEKPPIQDNDVPMMKQMEVCEVCGAFLIVGDAPQRQDEHLMGKQHAGYAQVRAELEKRKKKARDAMEAREANELKLKQERDAREKERQKEREQMRQRDRDRDRDRDRQRDRDRRRRSRSRSRDRRSRRRSSSRDRRRSRRSRSRSRDRRRRSGSRSRRRRSRSDDRKSSRRRSRSRHRSRSKDRKEKDNKGSKESDKDKEKSERHTSKEKETNNDAVKSDMETEKGEEPVNGQSIEEKKAEGLQPSPIAEGPELPPMSSEATMGSEEANSEGSSLQQSEGDSSIQPPV